MALAPACPPASRATAAFAAAVTRRTASRRRCALPEAAPGAVEAAVARRAALAAAQSAAEGASARSTLPTRPTVELADGDGPRRSAAAMRLDAAVPERPGGGRTEARDGEPSRSAVRRPRPPRTPRTPRYAGEHDSYLDVVGADAVADAVVACWASLVTARAVAYRRGRPAGPMAVVVQRMVAARAAGVFMTLNPANGDRATFVCEAVWGLGEPLVSRRGDARPLRREQDQRRGRPPRDRPQAHPARPRRAPSPCPDARAGPHPVLTDDELAELVRIGRAVETAAGAPQDGEFAVDDEGVHLLQARPETVWSQRPRSRRPRPHRAGEPSSPP